MRGGAILSTGEWQTKPYTEAILRQLEGECKVSLTRDGYSSSSHDYPDLSNVASYVECSSTNDDAIEDSSASTKDNVEDELRRMFETDSPKRVEKTKHVKPTDKTGRIKKKDKVDLREIFIRLFGSPLDDIEFRFKAAKLEKRRKTLPVSLKLNEEVLKPLQAVRKQRSDSLASVPKLQKTVQFANECQVDIEYTSATDLVIPPVYCAIAAASAVPTVMHNPQKSVCEIYTAKNVVVKPAENAVSAFIDLTEENSAPPYLEANDLRIEVPPVKNENVESEKANVPAIFGLSMPMLSPVSPALPQAEAVLPQGTGLATKQKSPQEGEHPISKKARLDTRSSQNGIDMLRRPVNERDVQTTIERQLKQAHFEAQNICQQELRRSNQYIFDERAKLEEMTRRAMQIPNPSPGISFHINSTNQPVPQLQSGVPPISQPHPAYSNLPQLHRIPQVLRAVEMISTKQFASKIYPHVVQLQKFRYCWIKFQESLKEYFTGETLQLQYQLVQDYGRKGLASLGEILLKDIRNVGVTNFILNGVNKVLAEIVNIFAEKGQQVNMFYVCRHIRLLQKDHGYKYDTKFLATFYKGVKLAFERMEGVYNKQQEHQIMNPVQIKLLEMQIKQYLMIQKWMANYHANRIRTMQAVSNPLSANNIPVNLNLCPNSQTGANQSKHTFSQNYRRQSNEYSNKSSTTLQTNNTITQTTSSTQRNIPEVQRMPPPYNHPHIIPVIPPTPLTYHRRQSQEESSNTARVTVPNLPTSQKPQENNVRPSVLIRANTTPVPVSSIPSPKHENVCGNMDAHEQDVKTEAAARFCDGEVIDLTWIDDADEKEIIEEVKRFKMEYADSTAEKTTSSNDRGVESSSADEPRSHVRNAESAYECLCGKKAIYVCACNMSMYCSYGCQTKDWQYHATLCQKAKP